MTLDPHERASYDRDGFLVREAVLSASEVERVRAACEELCEQLVACSREDRKVDVSSFYVFEPDARRSVLIKWEPGSRDVIQGIEPVVHLNPVLAEFGDHPALAEPARDLLDADAVGLFTEKLNVKRSRVGGAYALHRDLPYWIGVADDPESMITALLALDDATAENGAVEVLPGSHLLDDVPLKESDLDLERNEIDPERLDTSAMVPVELAAGSAVFFGPRLIHRSAPNRTSFDRRALLYTYQPSGARDLRTVQRAWLEGEPDPRTAATP